LGQAGAESNRRGPIQPKLQMHLDRRLEEYWHGSSESDQEVVVSTHCLDFPGLDSVMEKVGAYHHFGIPDSLHAFSTSAQLCVFAQLSVEADSLLTDDSLGLQRQGAFQM